VEEEKLQNLVRDDFGLKFSLSLPLQDRKRGVFHCLFASSLVNDRDHGGLYDEFSDAAHCAAGYFFEGLAVNDIRNDPDFRPLSPREKQCLTWCAAGRMTSEISAIMSISEATVNEYIANAVKKLKASNRAQACSRALLLELIKI